MPPGAMIAREHRVACVRRRGLREVRSGRGQREGLDMPRTPAIVGQRPGRAGWATSSLGEPWALAPEQLVATERRYQARTGARAAADQAIAQGRILHADAPSGSADAWPGWPPPTPRVTVVVTVRLHRPPWSAARELAAGQHRIGLRPSRRGKET